MKIEVVGQLCGGTIHTATELGDGEDLVRWLRADDEGPKVLRLEPDSYYPTHARAERVAMAYGIELGKKLERAEQERRAGERCLACGQGFAAHTGERRSIPWTEAQPGCLGYLAPAELTTQRDPP